MKKKKETYRQRWLKEHPEIHIHLPKDVYNKLLELENILGKNKNDIVKDLINGVVISFDEYRKKIEKEVGDKKFDEGYNSAYQEFVEFPDDFYNYIRQKYHIIPMLFSVPCSICKKPMIFSHEYQDEIKKTLDAAFYYWYHTCCKDVKDGVKGSCEHMK